MEKVISISSVDTDYYAWGCNCAFLDYDRNTAENCLAMEKYIDSESFDLFWSGYFENIGIYRRKGY